MFQDGEQEYVTLSQAEYEAHIVGTSSNVNFEPEQIPSDNVEGLQPTIEIQSNEWNNIPVSYFGETIDLTHLKRGLEGSLYRHRGGLVICTVTEPCSRSS